MAEVNRLGGGAEEFIQHIREIEKKIDSISTRGTGSIEMEEQIITTDPVTGVSTIFGALPDGTYGFQPFVNDTTPPDQPSTPSVVGGSTIFEISWNGLDVNGAEPPADFDRTIVEMSVSADNGIWSEVNYFKAAGRVVVGEQPVKQMRFFRLVSVDVNGNRSTPSAVASAQLTPYMESAEMTEYINNVEGAIATADEKAVTAQSAAQAASDAASAAQKMAEDAAKDSGNLIVNGSFEQDFAGWSKENNNGTIDTTVAYDGTKSFYTGTIGCGILQGPIPVTAGQIYRFAFRYKTVAGYPETTSGGLRLQVSRDGGATFTNTLNTQLAEALDWTYHQGEYTVPADVTHIRPRIAFAIMAGSGAWIDSVSLSDVTTIKALEKSATDAQLAADAAAEDARLAAEAAGRAQTAADGKATVWYQDTAPTGTSHAVNDIWFDTNDNNKPHRWNGSIWEVRADTTYQGAISSAIDDFETDVVAPVRQTVDGKNTVYTQATAPTAPVGGFTKNDVWYDTANKNEPKTWDGTKWVSARDALINDVDAKVDTTKTTLDTRITDEKTALTNKINQDVSAVDTRLTNEKTALVEKINTDIGVVNVRIENEISAVETNISETEESLSGKINTDIATALQTASDDASAKATTAKTEAIQAAETADAALKTIADNAQKAADEAKLAAINAANNATSILFDGGFESGVEGKEFVFGSSGMALVTDPALAHSGKNSVKVTRQEGSQYPGVRWRMKLEADRTYRVSFWMMAPTTASGTQSFYSRVEFASSGANGGWVAKVINIPNDGIWRQYSYDVKTEGTWDFSTVKPLWLQASASTTDRTHIAYLDDVSMVDVTQILALEKAAADANQRAIDAEANAKAEAKRLADLAQQAAIDAAEIDATTKATAAQTAAVNAARLDAEAQVEAAEGRAAIEAARVAKEQADLAEADAIAAAKTHADLVSGNAETAAIEAAAITAQNKADAAKTAAIEAARLETEAQVEDAEGRAAIEAARVAKEKADQALVDAKAADAIVQKSANDALALANAAIAASKDYVTDPTFLTGADNVSFATIKSKVTGITPLDLAVPAPATSWAYLQNYDNNVQAFTYKVEPGRTYQIDVDVVPSSKGTPSAAFRAGLRIKGAAGTWNYFDARQDDNSILNIPGSVTKWTHYRGTLTFPANTTDVEFQPWIRNGASANGWIATNWHVRDITEAKSAIDAAKAAMARAEAVKGEAETDATNKANAAKTAAIEAAKTDATAKANAAELAAKQAAALDAQAQVEAAESRSAEEAARVAAIKAEEARVAAVNAANLYAETQATNAGTEALNAAKIDATNKAAAAELAAKEAASLDAQAQVEAAEDRAAAEALRVATEKADQALSDAKTADAVVAQLANNAIDLAKTKGTTYFQATEPTPDMNGIWFDTSKGNLPHRSTTKRALFYSYSSGHSFHVELPKHGWTVDSRTGQVPDITLAKQYDLVVFDGGVHSVNEVRNYPRDFYNAGINVITTGNDLTSLPDMFTGVTTRTTEEKNTVPIRPTGTHPLSQGWTEFIENDVTSYMKGLSADAVPFAVTLAGGVDGVMAAVRENATTKVRWIHTHAAPSKDGDSGFTEAIISYMGPRWVPAQDAGIQAVADAAAKAQKAAELAAANAVNIVSDPSFESRATGETLGTLWTVDATTGRTGTKSVKGSAGTNSDTRYLHFANNIAVTPGQTWRFRLWFKTSADFNGAGSVNKMRISNQNDGVLVAPEFTVSTAWKLLETEYVVPTSGITALNFMAIMNQTVGSVWVDDVEATNITEYKRLEKAASDAQANAITEAQKRIDASKLVTDAAITEVRTAAQIADDRAREAAGLAGTKGKVWTQATAPTRGATYEWVSSGYGPYAVKKVDGTVTRTNVLSGRNPAALGAHTTVTPNVSFQGKTWARVSATQNTEVRHYAALTPMVQNQLYIASVLMYNESDTDFTSNFDIGDRAAGVFTVPARKAVRINSTPTTRPVDANNTGWTEVYRFFDNGVKANQPQLHTERNLELASTFDPNQPFFDGDTPDEREFDLWINTAEGNRPYRWDRTSKSWVQASDAAIAAAQGVADAAKTAAENAAKQHVNIIPDGSFEGAANSTALGTQGWVVDGTVARTGTKSAKAPANGTALNARYHNIVWKNPVLPGQIWRATAWYKTTEDYNGTSGNGKLRLGDQGNTGMYGLTFLKNTEWTKVTRDFEVPADGSITHLTLGLGADHFAGTLWVDDVVFSEVSALVALEQAAINAQKVADDALKGAQMAAKSGDNMIVNPTFELGGLGWYGQTNQIVTIPDAYSGTQAFQATSTGELLQDAIPTYEGQIWRAEIWYKTEDAYVSGSPGGLRIQYSKDNGATWIQGTYSNVDKSTVWAQSGLEFKMPAGTTHVRFRLAFAYSGGAKIWVDNAALRNVTEARATTEAITSVQTIANSKNIITNATVDPNSIGLTVGDLWWKRDSNGVISGQWEWTGGTSLAGWKKTSFDNAVIANIDAGKINAGTIDAARIGAKSIGVEKLTVTDFTNLVVNPRFEFGTNGLDGWTANQSGTVVADAGTLSGKALEISGTGGYPARYQEKRVPVAGGQKLRIKGKFKRSAETTNTNSGSIRVFSYGAYGSNSQGVYATAPTNANTWYDINAIITTPANTKEVVIWLEANTAAPVGSKVWFADLEVYKMSAGELIVDGAITTDKLDAQAVTAAKIAAGAVEADKIAANAITASKIAAGSITADRLLIGAAGNMHPDAQMIAPAVWQTTTTSTLEAVGTGMTGGGSIRIAPGTTLRGLYQKFTPEMMVPVTPGSSYRASVWVRADGDAPAASISMYGRAYKSNNIAAGHVWPGPDKANSPAAPANTWTKIEGIWTIPADYDRFAVGFYVQSTFTGAVRYSDVTVQPMIDGTLITSNAITAEKIAANAVEAAKIKAGAVETDKLAANAVTAAKISAGTITSTEIKAGSITATRLVMSDFQNLFEDPHFKAGPAVGGGATVYAGAEVVPGGYNAIQIGARDHSGSNKVPVKAGQSFYLAYTAKKILGEQDLNVALWLNNKDNARGVAWSQWSLNSNTYKTDRTSTDLGNGWFRYTMGITIPETWTDVDNAAIYFQINQYSPYTTTWLVSDIEWRRRSNAELIVDGAVTANKVAANAITAGKINAGAVETDKLAANAVVADKIAANAVEATKIKAGAVETDKLAANAVVADKINANAVTSDKIVANAIVSDKIATNAVTSDKITANAITADKIDANAVTAVKINADAVESDKIKAGAIVSDKIAANAVIAEKIAANAIEAGKIKADAVTSEKIAADAVVADKIAANAITATKILSGAVETDKLAANAVTASKIDANAVTAEKIAAGSITANKLAVGDMTNLWHDPKLDETWYGTVSKYTGTEVIPNSKPAIQIGSTDHISYHEIVAQAGDGFRIRFTAKRIAGDDGINAVPWIRNATGQGGTGWQPWGLLSYQGGYAPKVIADLGNGWSRYESAVVIPETWTDVANVRFYLQIPNNTDKATQWLVSDLDWRRTTGITLIQDGAITTDKIASRTITAEDIATNTITATSGVIGSIDASVITVGEMDAARLKAGSIQTDRMVVGQGENLVVDPEFSAPATGNHTSARTAGASAGAIWVSPNRIGWNVTTADTTARALHLGGSTANAATPTYPVVPGRTYVITYNTISQAASSTVGTGARVNWISETGVSTTVLATPVASATDIVATNYVKVSLGTSVERRFTITAPADAKVMRLDLLTNGHPGGGRLDFIRPAIRLMTDGTSITGSAITTSHIAANTITGGNLNVSSVQTAIITSSVFSGKTFTGGTWSGDVHNGATFQTVTDANRGVKMTPSGFFAYDGSGNTMVSIDTSGNATFKGNVIVTGGTIPVANLEGTIPQNKVANLETLSSTVSTQGTDLTNLSGTVSTQGTNLTNLSGTVSTQGTNLTNLTGTVNTQGETLSGVNGKVTSWTFDGTSNINGGMIQANSVKANQIELSAVGSQMIKDGVLQTVVTANRGVKITEAGLSAYNDAGTETIRIASDGSAMFTGNVTVKDATITGSLFQTHSAVDTGLKIDNAGIRSYRQALAADGSPLLDANGQPYQVASFHLNAADGNMYGNGGSLINATVRTSGTVNSGVIMDSAGLRAYNGDKQEVFNLSTGTGRLEMRGQFRTATGTQPQVIISGSDTSYNNRQLAIWFSPDGTAPGFSSTSGVVAGIWMEAIPTIASGYPLTMRGQSGAGVKIYGGLTVAPDPAGTGSASLISSIAGKGLNFRSYGAVDMTANAAVEIFGTGESSFNATGTGNAVHLRSHSGNAWVRGNARVYLESNTGGVVLSSAGVAGYKWESPSSANVYMNSDGVLFKSTSSIRYKKAITDWKMDPEGVLKLQPRKWQSKHMGENGKEDKTYYVGFIAEEVERIYPELVTYEPDHETGELRPDGLQYDRFSTVLVAKIKQQEEHINTLEARLVKLEKAILNK